MHMIPYKSPDLCILFKCAQSQHNILTACIIGTANEITKTIWQVLQRDMCIVGPSKRRSLCFLKYLKGPIIDNDDDVFPAWTPRNGKKVHPLHLLLAPLFQKCVLNVRFWKSAICDVIKGTNIWLIPLPTPTARCSFHPLSTSHSLLVIALF